MTEIQNKMQLGDEEIKFATSDSIEENSGKFATAAALYRLYQSLGDLFGKKVDATPLVNSTDLVSSGGVAAALGKKMNTDTANANYNKVKANVNTLAQALGITLSW